MTIPSGVRFWVPVTLILIGFSCASGLALLELRRDSYELATGNVRNLLSVLSQEIEGSLAGYDRTLGRIVAKLEDPDLARLDPALQQRYLFEGALAAPSFMSILVLDAAGHVVRDAGAFPPRPDNLSDRGYFRAEREGATEGPHLSGPFRGGLTGSDEVVALTRRIVGPDGAFAGVVVGTVSLDYFRGLFERASLGASDSINLFSTAGVLLMRTPYHAEQIGRDLAGNENVRRFIEEGSGTFSGVAAVDGVQRVYTFARVGDLPLILNVALGEEAIYAGWRARALQISAILVLMSLLALSACLRMRRELARRTRAETAALRSETEYRLLADNATDIILRIDETLTRRYVSPACRHVLGHEPEDLVGRRSRELIHPDDWPVVERTLRAARETGEPVEAVYRVRHRSGADVWVEGRYRRLPGEEGYLVALRDISKRKAAEAELEAVHARLQDLANKDGLTGLANRRQFDAALEQACARAPGEVSLLLLDVDHFKRFNDRYGHQAGDDCLRRVAGAIAGCVRAGDVVARYGGEEFAIVLPEADEATAHAIAERIRDTVRALAIAHEGSREAGGPDRVAASLGCATQVGPAPGDPAALVRRADLALYEAKRTGRDRVVSAGAMPNDPKAPRGPNEERRGPAVSRVREGLDAGRSAVLHAVAREAASLMDTPIGFVSLIGADSAWLVGREGIEAEVMARDVAFCSHTVTGSEPMVVTDLSSDPRFRDNPLVRGEGGLRFYVGAPFLDPGEGVWLGAVCAVGPETREPPTPGQREALKALGRKVAACLQ